MSNPYNNKSLLKKAQTKASKLNVKVKPSTRKGKKLDVFKNNKKVASIGAVGYQDFNIHKDKKRQKNYKQRHAKNLKKVGSPGYYANKILW